MSVIHVDIVSAEREIYSGEVAMVFAPAIMGEVGIAPGHAALITRMGPSSGKYRTTEPQTISCLMASNKLLRIP